MAMFQFSARQVELNFCDQIKCTVPLTDEVQKKVQDAAKELRRSHLNPVVQEVYADYLGAWGGEKAHHILHTKYHAQPKYRL